MKQIIALLFFDILSFENIIFCILKFNNYNCLNLLIITARHTNFGLSKLTSFLVFNDVYT